MGPGAVDSLSSPRAAELPGRQRELERLDRELARARNGEMRFIALVGDAGVGKTRLLREVARRAAAEQLVLGLHLPPGRITPADLIEEWIPPAVRSAGRRSAFDLTLAAAVYPRLRELLPVAGAATAGPASKASAVAALARLLAEAADRRPLLFLIDDLPEFRPDVRGLVADLALGLAGTPALFLATARLERGQRDPLRDRALASLTAKHLLERVDVEPLARSGLAELIAGELDGRIVPTLLPWLEAKSAGNPLFAVELIRALEGQGILFVDRESGSWQLAGPLKRLRLPDTIAHVLDARRRALAPELAQALPILALLGVDAPDAILAPALGLAGSEAVEDLKLRLRRAGVLVRVSAGVAGERDAFSHALMGEHWALELRVAERRRLAAQAQAQIAGEIAGRSESPHAGETGSCINGFERAREDELLRLVTYAELAGDGDVAVRSAIELSRRSLNSYRPHEAVGWSRRARPWLDRVEVGGEEQSAAGAERARWLRGQLDFLLGSALAREGRLAAAEIRLRRFLDSPEATDPLRGISAFIRLGSLLNKRGKLEEARRVYERGLAGLEHAVTPTAHLYRSDLLGNLAFIDTEQGDFESAESHLAEAEICLQSMKGDPRVTSCEMLLLHNRAALAAERGQLRQAIADFERLIELDAEAIAHGAHPEVLMALGQFRMLVGDLGTARTLLERGMRSARRNDDHMAAAVGLGTSALVESAAGDWNAALVSAERARRLSEVTQHRAGWLQTMADLGRIHAALGNRAASDRAFAEAAGRLGDRAEHARGQAESHYFRWSRAWALCRRQEWDSARQACVEAMASAAKRSNPLLHTDIELVALEVATRTGGAPPNDYARRLQAIEAVLRPQVVRGALVDLARVRLYGWLAGWGEIDPAAALDEIAAHLEVMGAAARGQEIANAFATTAVAATPEGRTALARLAGQAVGDSALREAAVRLAHPVSLEPALPYERPRIAAFGHLAVTRAGETEPVTRSAWGSRKARLLLAYFLAADPEARGVTRDALCDAVWPDSDSLNLERTFRVTMTFLRRAMGSSAPPGTSPGELRLLVFRNGLYHLDPKAMWCDVREFDRLVSGASVCEQSGDHAAALGRRRAAFELYRGELLADFDEPWIESRRESYRRRFVQLGTVLFDAAFRERRIEEAEEVAERVVASDPLAEDGHRLLIRAYLAAGRRDAAVRQLDRCRAILHSELGIEVSARTAALLSP